MKGNKKRLNAKQKKALWCYLILSTQIIGYGVFTIYPHIWAIIKSFFFYDQVPSHTKFVGLENYITVFSKDTAYWRSWVNTLLFTLGKMPLELPLAMIVALCLSRKQIKGKGLFRAVYYLPNILSVAIIGLIISNIFQYFGYLNSWLKKLGIISANIDWFGTRKDALIMLVIGSVWNTFGINVLYFMSAIANIPKDVYESAKLDGASGWTTFWKIMVPMMAPVLQTILLLALNGTLHTGTYILATTNGAPYGQTYTVLAYQAGKFVPGFADSTSPNIGYGSAVCVVTSVFMILIALAYMKISKRLQEVY